MKKLIILFAIPLLIYGGYKLAYPTYSWNQKLTIEVDTPEGVKTGSSVINIWVRYRPQILPDASGVFNGMRGEATVVDLGGGRTLFALLQGSRAMTERVFGANDPDLWYENGSTRKRKATPVPLNVLPMLVTFDDVTDPKTVRLVDPADLAASFGAGYALRKVTLEITREPVTSGVVEGMPFWGALKKQGTLSGLQMYDPNFPEPINYETSKVFKREAIK